ncbi:MAG TPA: hypothetical protein VMB75_09995 [Rhodocyclaceae bacterium]|nr:hypothetical protein [Rhodocyclaceae bacterium]
MTRDEMIQLLVVDDLECRIGLRGDLWLQKILEHGFRGYANMSGGELAAEMAARSLGRFGALRDENEDLQDADDDAELVTLVHQCQEGLRDR